MLYSCVRALFCCIGKGYLVATYYGLRTMFTVWYWGAVLDHSGNTALLENTAHPLPLKVCTIWK